MNKRIKKKKEKELDFFLDKHGGASRTWKEYKDMERTYQSAIDWHRINQFNNRGVVDELDALFRENGI